MIKLLLDTHVWIWSLQQQDRLNAKARRQIENSANELYLSPISIWEAHYLAQRRKLRYAGPFAEWLDRAWRTMPIREASVTFTVAEQASRLHLPQGDFGDLFLAATASVFDFTLVTADEQLLAHPAIRTLPAGR